MTKTEVHKSFEELFYQFLRRNKLSLEDIDFIKSKIKVLNLRKGECFLREGQICNKVGFLIQGLLYAYYETEEKLVSRFFHSKRNIIVTAFESFKKKNPSREQIEAIEDSYLFYFSSLDLQMFYDKYPRLNEIGRSFAEDSYLHAMNRIHQLQSMDTKSRFEIFYRENPTLFNRVKIIDIASYLRMNRNLVSKYMKEMNNAI